jgi:hypothetical protein
VTEDITPPLGIDTTVPTMGTDMTTGSAVKTTSLPTGWPPWRSAQDWSASALVEAVRSHYRANRPGGTLNAL